MGMRPGEFKRVKLVRVLSVSAGLCGGERRVLLEIEDEEGESPGGGSTILAVSRGDARAAVNAAVYILECLDGDGGNQN